MHVHSQKMSASNSVKSALVDQDGLNLSGARKECFADESLADAFCIWGSPTGRESFEV